MKRIGYSVVLVTCAAALILLVSERTSASDRLNFSGKYVVEQKKDASEDVSTLEVTQDNDSIEITRVELGKKTVSHCPLNGSDGEYTSPGGVPGKCKVQLKPKYLLLESVILTHPQEGPMRLHTKEKWQLSADAKTLTIKSEVDLPDVPADVSALVAGQFANGTVKYRRVGP